MTVIVQLKSMIITIVGEQNNYNTIIQEQTQKNNDCYFNNLYYKCNKY